MGSKDVDLDSPATLPPAVAADSEVVRVAAVGLNPTDWKHVGNGMHLNSHLLVWEEAKG